MSDAERALLLATATAVAQLTRIVLPLEHQTPIEEALDAFHADHPEDGAEHGDEQS